MFANYCVIGGVATSVHYTVLFGLIELFAMPPYYATAIGAIIGAFVSYFGNKRFSFLNDSQHRVALPRFFMVAGLGALMNSWIVWAGTQLMGWNYIIPQIMATLSVVIITYYLNRTWTFG